jgi:hypothetical protein
MELAPIGLSVYSRLAHIKKTVCALKRNELASESTLFVFSDAPQKGDEERVVAVRKYLRTISGFKQIHLLERETNSRIENNRQGIQRLLTEYGKMIFLEEDIVTAPKFIEFMNQALDFYQADQRILAITGYSPPFTLPASYKKDIYLSLRFSAWGFGIWKERYDKIKMKIEDYEEFLKDKAAVKRFRVGGEDLLHLLKREAEGQIDALDIKINYHQSQQNLYTVAPSVSLVQNIGHDGTGVYCINTRSFDVTLDTSARPLKLEKDLQPDPNLIKCLYAFRSGGPKGMIGRLLKRFGLWSATRFILKAIR